MNRSLQFLACFICGALLVWLAACRTITDMDRTARAWQATGTNLSAFVTQQNLRSSQTHAEIMDVLRGVAYAVGIVTAFYAEELKSRFRKWRGRSDPMQRSRQSH